MSGGTVAAIVVNYNAGDSLAACIDSLRKEAIDEVVVVDNGSSDQSVERLPADSAVRVVVPGRNLGFGGGVNFGARQSSKALLLVCNADVVLQPSALAALVTALERDGKVGLVGPALLAPDGRVRRSGGAFPSVKRSILQALLGVLLPNGAYSRRHRERNRALVDAGGTDWVTGACFLVRRSAFDAVGGFDPRYFMYVEEVDLCWRLAAAGWATAYEPSARVVHSAGVSTSRHPFSMIVAHHRSLWRYARQTTRGAWRLALPFVGIGIGLRCAFVLFLRAFERARRAKSTS